MQQKQAGFTIVELLIVIVVIGVLAALVMSSFNGAQARAANTHTADSVAKYAKAILSFSAEKGAYPTSGLSCLGEGYDGNICSSTNGTSACFGTGVAGVDGAFLTDLRPYIGNPLPTLNKQKISCGGSSYVGGFYYYDSPSNIAGIYYYLRGNVQCPGVGGAKTVQRQQSGDATMCILNFPQI